MGDVIPIEERNQNEKSKKKNEDTEMKSAAVNEEGDDSRKEGEEEISYENSLVDDKRLFVMNLSYSVNHDELNDLFGKYGKVENIEIPLGKWGRGPLGIGFIKFETAEAAISAYAQLDKSYF